MTNEGLALNHPDLNFPDKDDRTKFAIEMLRKMIPALQRLHELGYSHSDLKLQNICARKTSSGKYNFTLIDLGMATKLFTLGDKNRNYYFRGNFMFASPWHIYTQRSSALDDLYSLLCVAQFYIMGNRLPWVTYIIE